MIYYSYPFNMSFLDKRATGGGGRGTESRFSSPLKTFRTTEKKRFRKARSILWISAQWDFVLCLGYIFVTMHLSWFFSSTTECQTVNQEQPVPSVSSFTSFLLPVILQFAATNVPNYRTVFNHRYFTFCSSSDSLATSVPFCLFFSQISLLCNLLCRNNS